MKDKVVIKYNKRENDLETHYIDRGGDVIGRNFYMMFSLFMGWKEDKKHWTQYGFSDYAKYLDELGYDYKSLRITINKKKIKNTFNS